MRRSVRGIAAMTASTRPSSTALPKLEIIASFGVGYDSVDAAMPATRGVMVTNTPDVLTEEVADTALGLLLNTLRELPQRRELSARRPLGEGGRLSADAGARCAAGRSASSAWAASARRSPGGWRRSACRSPITTGARSTAFPMPITPR